MCWFFDMVVIVVVGTVIVAVSLFPPPHVSNFIDMSNMGTLI